MNVFGPEMPSEEVWNTSLRLHEQFLRQFARRYLESGGLYNAAKHGLALTPQEEAGVAFAGILDQHGPAIHNLTVRHTPSQPIPRWTEVIHWVESDKLMALTSCAITQIRMLWRIALSLADTFVGNSDHGPDHGRATAAVYDGVTEGHDRKAVPVRTAL